MSPGPGRHARGPLHSARLRPPPKRWGLRHMLLGAGLLAALGAGLVVVVSEQEPPPGPAEPASAPPPVEARAEQAPAAPPEAVDGPSELRLRTEVVPEASTAAPEPAEVAPAPQVVQEASPSPEAPTPPTPRLDAEERAADLAEGERLLAQGDVAAARLFFARLAEAGDPRGAEGLARSYDPAVLADLPVHGITGDPTTAQRWREAAGAAR